ncbi:MAG TPA: hypothetical protein VGM43_08845 [Bryobacteraceae bacterium]
MPISADELRRYYAGLSDAALLELNPDELTPVARGCYDEEFSKRGLSDEAGDEESSDAAGPVSDGQPHAEEEMVCVAEYDFVEEADMAKGLLVGAEIPAVIDRDATLVRLMVPPDLAEQALGLLTTPLSDEELAAQAEAAGEEEEFSEEDEAEKSAD